MILGAKRGGRLLTSHSSGGFQDASDWPLLESGYWIKWALFVLIGSGASQLLNHYTLSK